MLFIVMKLSLLVSNIIGGGGGWGKGVPYSSDAISYCFKIACQRMFQLSDPGVDCSLQWTTFSFAYDTCR